MKILLKLTVLSVPAAQAFLGSLGATESDFVAAPPSAAEEKSVSSPLGPISIRAQIPYFPGPCNARTVQDARKDRQDARGFTLTPGVDYAADDGNKYSWVVTANVRRQLQKHAVEKEVESAWPLQLKLGARPSDGGRFVVSDNSEQAQRFLSDHNYVAFKADASVAALDEGMKAGLDAAPVDAARASEQGRGVQDESNKAYVSKMQQWAEQNFKYIIDKNGKKRHVRKITLQPVPIHRTGDGSYANFVHQDFRHNSRKAAEKNLPDGDTLAKYAEMINASDPLYFGVENDAKKRLVDGVVSVSLWRSTLSTPLEHTPLAFADKKSIDYTTDLVDIQRVATEKKSGGHVPLNSLQAAPEHKWRYFPQVQNDDILVFKHFEVLEGLQSRATEDVFAEKSGEFSDSSRAAFHTAIVDPTTSKDAPKRQSVEVRAFFFLDGLDPEDEKVMAADTAAAYAEKEYKRKMFAELQAQQQSKKFKLHN